MPTCQMPQKLYQDGHIIGEIGTLFVAGTACIYGVKGLPQSLVMAAMAGSGSFWMANWQQCTPVEVLKVARTAQVSVLYANLYVFHWHTTDYLHNNQNS